MAEAIKVALRVRPFNTRELQSAASNKLAVSTLGSEATLHSEAPKVFAFDFAYSSDGRGDTEASCQDAVYRDVGKTMVQSALDGFNSSLFAYGQTGSGKSYTVMGIGKEQGLVPRCIGSIFEEKSKAESGTDHMLEIRTWVSFVEIYNEHVRDLLSEHNDLAEDLKIIDHPKHGACIPNLTEKLCNMEIQVTKFLELGMKKRVTGRTQMNATSSRSHAVFTLKVQRLEGPRPQPGAQDERKATIAKLNLADLAGSERQAKTGAEGARLKEGCMINQSLSTLAQIIKELSENAGKRASRHCHIAFRASKLTFLLKDSLCGNSRSFMVACVSPSIENISETHSTLRFASSVKKIKTTATQNRTSNADQTAALQLEIRMLKQELAEAHRAGDPEELQRVEDLLTFSRRAEKQLMEEQQEREEALRTGISNDELAKLMHVDKTQPYFLNMSDDPLIAGCLIYYISQGQGVTVGSADDNTICLRGLGMAPHLCRVTCKGDSNVIIMKLGLEGSLRVSDGRSGKPLANGESRSLSHNDKVYMGRTLALRLVVPSQARSKVSDAEEVSDLSLDGLESEMCVVEGSEKWESFKDYLGQTKHCLSAEDATKLKDEFQKALALCELAKDITAVCRPSEALHFEVDLTSYVPSSVVIRVHCRGREPESEPGMAMHGPPLYIWSVSQMAERVKEMQDYFDELQIYGDAQIDPLLDPWHEPTRHDIARRIAEHGIMVQAEHDRYVQCRFRALAEIRRLLHVWMDSDAGTILRNCFSVWSEMSIPKTGRRKPILKPSVMQARAPSSSEASQRRDSSGRIVRDAAPAMSSSRKSGLSAKVSATDERRSSLSKQGPLPARQSLKVAEEADAKEPQSASDVAKGAALPEPLAGVAGAENAARQVETVDPAAEKHSVGGNAKAEAASSAENEILRKELEEVWRLCDMLTKQMKEHMTTQATTCRQCGNIFMADSEFCRHCGSKREAAQNGWPPLAHAEALQAAILQASPIACRVPAPSLECQQPLTPRNHAEARYVGTSYPARVYAYAPTQPHLSFSSTTSHGSQNGASRSQSPRHRHRPGALTPAAPGSMPPVRTASPVGRAISAAGPPSQRQVAATTAAAEPLGSRQLFSAPLGSPLAALPTASASAAGAVPMQWLPVRTMQVSK